MRFVSFVGLTENGPVSVAAGHTVGPLLEIAKKARDAGMATVDGEATPILGGCVFASDALLQGPVLEFRCTPAVAKKGKKG